MSQCPYGFFHYTVKSGDSLSSLAEKFRVSEQTLKDLNGSAPLRKNMRIRVPCACGCGRGSFYAIRRGETLVKIAQRNGLALDELLSANPYLNPARFAYGQVIVIPPPPKRDVPAHYTLEDGESLFDVLRKFRMDLTTFCMLNPDISPLTLKSGQRVGIRQPRMAGGRWYTVQPDEHLVSIAQRHGIRVSALLAANENLRPSDFVPGRKVRIPTK